MYRVCIALIDATRARLFTFERESQGAAPHDELIERVDVENPQRRRRSSRNGHLPRASDDQRDHRAPQLDDRFARAALAALRELIDERPTQRVVLCASPRTLTRLRSTTPGLVPADIALDELPRDLVELSTGDVQAELAARALLPPADQLPH